MERVTKGWLIASAAAALILSGTVPVRAADKAGGDVVECAGVNACKGHGACKSADNACKGKNGCKGKGFVQLSAADCAKQGGKVVEEKKGY